MAVDPEPVISMNWIKSKKSRQQKMQNRVKERDSPKKPHKNQVSTNINKCCTSTFIYKSKK